MSKRYELQTLLESLLGSKNVYFQPPENVKLDYPCIIYSRSNIKTDFANDNPYSQKIRYNVMVIDKIPDSPIIEKLAALPSCTYDRHYTKDNLNHEVFNLYYKGGQ